MRLLAAIASRRGAAGAALVVAIAAGLSVATYSRSELQKGVGSAVGHGVDAFNTVAAMLAARSPGERPNGALASLKPKRPAAPHERALPKVRGPAPNPLASIVGAAPVPPVLASPPVAATPLFNVVAPPPVMAPAVIPGTSPGGFFPAITQPGGGGIIIPPIVTPATPVTPVTPLPEPGTWAMMILGLMVIGRIARRDRKAATAE